MFLSRIPLSQANLISWVARGSALCEFVSISLYNAYSGFVSLLIGQVASPGSWAWTPTDAALIGDDYFVNVKCADGSFQDNSSTFQISMTPAPSPAPTAAPSASPSSAPPPSLVFSSGCFSVLSSSCLLSSEL